MKLPNDVEIVFNTLSNIIYLNHPGDRMAILREIAKRTDAELEPLEREDDRQLGLVVDLTVAKVSGEKAERHKLPLGGLAANGVQAAR